MNLIILVLAFLAILPSAAAQEKGNIEQLCQEPYAKVSACGDYLARIPTGGYMSEKLGYGMQISDASTDVYDRNGTLLGGCGGMGSATQDQALCAKMSECKPEDLCAGIPAQCPQHDALCKEWNETVRKAAPKNKL